MSMSDAVPDRAAKGIVARSASKWSSGPSTVSGIAAVRPLPMSKPTVVGPRRAPVATTCWPARRSSETRSVVELKVPPRSTAAYRPSMPEPKIVRLWPCRTV